MVEAVKNVIVISVCLGIVSMLPLREANLKYIKYTASAVLAVTCIIPLIKCVGGMAMEFPAVENTAYENSGNDLIIEKCRKKIEDDTVLSLYSKFGDGCVYDVSITLNSDDIQNIVIKKVTVYNNNADEKKLREYLSELLCTEKNKIIVETEVREN